MRGISSQIPGDRYLVREESPKDLLFPGVIPDRGTHI